MDRQRTVSMGIMDKAAAALMAVILLWLMRGFSGAGGSVRLGCIAGRNQSGGKRRRDHAVSGKAGKGTVRVFGV